MALMSGIIKCHFLYVTSFVCYLMEDVEGPYRAKALLVKVKRHVST